MDNRNVMFEDEIDELVDMKNGCRTAEDKERQFGTEKLTSPLGK